LHIVTNGILLGPLPLCSTNLQKLFEENTERNSEKLKMPVDEDLMVFMRELITKSEERTVKTIQDEVKPLKDLIDQVKIVK